MTETRKRTGMDCSPFDFLQPLEIHKDMKTSMKNKQGTGMLMRMAILMSLVTPAIHAEEIPDLTNGGVPMSCNTRRAEPSIDWALGPLGANGWGYSRIPIEGGSVDARQLLITRVDKKGPSNGLLLLGDVIIGVNGAKFSRDVRKALTEAINQAETTEAGGKLKLMVWRPAKPGSTTGTVNDVVVPSWDHTAKPLRSTAPKPSGSSTTRSLTSKQTKRPC
jgi:Family of unknown function (DUF6288)